VTKSSRKRTTNGKCFFIVLAPFKMCLLRITAEEGCEALNQEKRVDEKQSPHPPFRF
jgi:hypothetical protein